LLRTEYGQYIKNKAITHNLDALSHTAILATGEKPEVSKEWAPPNRAYEG